MSCIVSYEADSIWNRMWNYAYIAMATQLSVKSDLNLHNPSFEQFTPPAVFQNFHFFLMYLLYLE